MEALSNSFNQGLPLKLLYADDVVLLAESEEKLPMLTVRWKKGTEDKGLRVDFGKTKVTKCQVSTGHFEGPGEYPSGVCRHAVGWNLIKFSDCFKCTHKICCGAPGLLKDVD